MAKKVKDNTIFCTVDLTFIVNGALSEEEVLEEIKNRMIEDAGADDAIIKKIKIFPEG